jgi:hypothetical protein
MKHPPLNFGRFLLRVSSNRPLNTPSWKVALLARLAVLDRPEVARAVMCL